MTNDPSPFANPTDDILKHRASLPDGVLVAKLPIQAAYKGQRARAVWNRVWLRPLVETDHDFYIFLARETLTEDWLNVQASLPDQEQHIILRWFKENDRLRAQTLNGVNPVLSATRTGDITELLTLGRDLFDLQTTHQLPDELLARLKDRSEFQGARYEIAVASACVRAGYTIKWTTRHEGHGCEFVATSKKGEHSIAVEAKSRRRPGVIHEIYFRTKKGLYSGIRHLLAKAKRNSPGGMPFVVFVDLNLPPNHKAVADQNAFMETARGILGPYGRNTVENPDVCTAMFFTNFAWHYHKDKPGSGATVIMVTPKYVQHPAHDGLSIAILEKAVNEHDVIPNIFPTAEEVAQLRMDGRQQTDPNREADVAHE